LFAALLLEPRFLNFGASCFFYLGASLLGALDSLGPRAVWIQSSECAETGNKKTVLGLPFGISVFKFRGLTFSEDLGLFGARRRNTETGNKKTFGPSLMGPRFLDFGALAFSGGLGLFRAPHWRTVWVSQ
jgi:hypothetical protein